MQAYLYTETDGNDLSYFLIHQLQAIKQAIISLHEYLHKKSSELKEADDILENSSLKGQLNYRQLSILKNAIKNPCAEYTIKSHQKSHGASYQTTRTELLALSDDFQILNKYKVGKRSTNHTLHERHIPR